METRTRSSIRAVLAIFLFATFVLHPLRSHGHHCGQPEITLRVGEQTLWHITADRVEQDTLYQPILESTENSSIFPADDFWARHGMFLITGIKPGTNTILVRWTYPPTQAGGTCSVRVNVLPADSPRETDGYLPGFAPTVMLNFYNLNEILKGRLSPQVHLLIVATHTLAGNLALSALQHRIDTLILSATSPEQESHFGGYHDDAARALKPGPDTTAEDVHIAGMIGSSHVTPPRHGDPLSADLDYQWGEWPMFTGTLGLKDFSLAPTTEDGPIRRRVVLIYDPKPKSHAILTDIIRDATIPSDWGTLREFGSLQDIGTIKANWAGQLNTWVRTISGAPMTMGTGLGKDGFDYSADAYGIDRAIREAGDYLNQDPAHSQLIMFFGGRGGLSALPLVEYAEFSAGTKYQFPGDFGAKLSWSLDSLNEFEEPRSAYANMHLWTLDQNPFRAASIGTNLFQLRFEPSQGTPLTFSPARVRTNDFNADGVLSTNLGEGLQVVFRLSFDQARLISTNPGSLFVENSSGKSYTIRSFNWNMPATGRSSAPRTISWIESASYNPDASLNLRLRGNPGDVFALERTSDFASWQLVQNVSFQTEEAQVTDTGASTNRNGSYRLRWINQ